MKASRPKIRLLQSLARNARTIPPHRGPQAAFPGSPAPFQELFVAQYGSIRDICAHVDTPGLAVVAVNCERGELAAAEWLASNPNDVNTAVIGRHTRCSVVLRDDPSVSLRHLALILHPSGIASESGRRRTRFHLVDLRTRLGFRDENGERLEALVSEGPVFVQCGCYALFLLVTGPDARWPESAELAWQEIPDRVYVDRRSGAAPEHLPSERLLSKRQHSVFQVSGVTSAAEEVSMVTLVEGPERPKQLLADSTDEPLGTLDVRAGHQLQKFVVGIRAAGTGILLGCYSRCDSECLSLLRNRHISRVHLLLLRVDEQLYVLDMASTNGTFLDGRVDDSMRVRQLALNAETCLTMAKRAATLTWLPRAA